MKKPLLILSAFVALSLPVLGCNLPEDDATSGQAFMVTGYVELNWKDGTRVVSEDTTQQYPQIPQTSATFGFDGEGTTECGDGTTGSVSARFDYYTDWLETYTYLTGLSIPDKEEYSGFTATCKPARAGAFAINRVKNFVMRIQMAPTSARCSHICSIADQECNDRCRSSLYLFGAKSIEGKDLQDYNDQIALRPRQIPRPNPEHQADLMVRDFVIDSYHTVEGDFIGSAAATSR